MVLPIVVNMILELIILELIVIKKRIEIFYLQSKCAGFDLARVIDNKKSWVYNPGSFTGVTLEDVNIVKHGDENLIQGFGVINRTFAPSV